MPITIDPEFRDLLRALTDEEKETLTEDILDNGCREPLVVWGDILLDGHHRYNICIHNNRTFTTVAAPDWIKDREDAAKWIRRNQRARRNLDKKELSFLRGMMHKATKKEEGAQEGNANASNQRCQNVSVDSKRTAEVLAEEFGVSPRTIYRDEKFADAVNKVAAEEGEQAKREILEGKRKLPKEEKEKTKKPNHSDGQEAMDRLNKIITELREMQSGLNPDASSRVGFVKTFETIKRELNKLFIVLIGE